MPRGFNSPPQRSCCFYGFRTGGVFGFIPPPQFRKKSCQPPPPSFKNMAGGPPPPPLRAAEEVSTPLVCMNNRDSSRGSPDGGAHFQSPEDGERGIPAPKAAREPGRGGSPPTGVAPGSDPSSEPPTGSEIRCVPPVLQVFVRKGAVLRNNLKTKEMPVFLLCRDRHRPRIPGTGRARGRRGC